MLVKRTNLNQKIVTSSPSFNPCEVFGSSFLLGVGANLPLASRQGESLPRWQHWEVLAASPGPGRPRRAGQGPYLPPSQFARLWFLNLLKSQQVTPLTFWAPPWNILLLHHVTSQQVDPSEPETRSLLSPNQGQTSPPPHRHNLTSLVAF